MESDEILQNAAGEATSLRVTGLICDGERYQIAAATDEERGEEVALRAIAYGDDGQESIRRRRRSLRRQWEFLNDVAQSGVAPEPIEWLEVADSPVDDPPEPVLVCERVDGPTLYDWVVDEHPRGIEPVVALKMLAQLVDFLDVAHRNKWLWRDFDPRRLVVVEQRDLRAISIGRVVRRGEAMEGDELEVNADYTAPEIRDEKTGKLQKPPADMYGLGALLSFMVTGEEPRHRVESPLSYRAYERIQEWDVPGLELLIARLLQPLAKKRVRTAGKLRAYCDVESLPTREDKGFGMCTLPAPWLGLDIENPSEHKGLGSSLSSGPLVSVREGATEEPAAAVVEQRAPNWPVIAVVVLVVAVAIFVVVGL